MHQLKNSEFVLKGINEMKDDIWLNYHSIQLQVNGADGNRTGEHEITRRTLCEHGYGRTDVKRV